MGFTHGDAPARSTSGSVLIHYEGHKSKYDEYINVQSPRLAPFRSRTTRPLSVTMQSVEKVVNGASVRYVLCVCVRVCVLCLRVVCRKAGMPAGVDVSRAGVGAALSFGFCCSKTQAHMTPGTR